jgi:hypothetical protein
MTYLACLRCCLWEPGPTAPRTRLAANVDPFPQNAAAGQERPVHPPAVGVDGACELPQHLTPLGDEVVAAQPRRPLPLRRRMPPGLQLVEPGADRRRQQPVRGRRWAGRAVQNGSYVTADRALPGRGARGASFQPPRAYDTSALPSPVDDRPHGEDGRVGTEQQTCGSPCGATPSTCRARSDVPAELRTLPIARYP